MPKPLSRTCNSKRVLPTRWVANTTQPCGVYLMALSSRLPSTCRSMAASERTRNGGRLRGRTFNVRPRWAALGANWSCN
ncbi:hypothetical protein, partial [Methylogaea oryzae]|uniref:hypothetical protein n=1 Tax=Methylogaea oryzae TaxID=1295382 RepID=UPI0020D18442